MKLKPFEEQHPELKAAVLDPETAVYYGPHHAKYAFYINNNYGIYRGLQFSKIVGNHPISGAGFYYCPWSGDYLNNEVRDIWFDRMQKLLPDASLLQLDSVDPVPRRYRDETWWLEEGFETVDLKDYEIELQKEAEEYKLDGEDYFERDGTPVNWTSGFWRFPHRPPHLCRSIAEDFWDCRYTITYIPWTREYGFRRYQVARDPIGNPIRMRKFDYCYNCGAKLPSSLKAQWLEEIAAAGYTPNDEDLPPEFLSDEWWKKRGL